MRNIEGFQGNAAQTAEAMRDAEVGALLEFLSIYKKIQEIATWLFEASADADLTIKARRRADLQRLILQLGLDPESPDAYAQLEAMRAGLLDRSLHPIPMIEVPEVGFFKSRIKELVAEQRKNNDSLSYSYAPEEQADLADIAQYGHTNWAEVQSRTGGSDVSAWIHGVAKIMADPVAYQAQFAGLGLSTGRQTADHLEISEDWSILNGRHRSLAARSLGEKYVHEAGMSQWIPVKVQQD